MSGDVEVRQATPADAGDVARLLHDFNTEFGDPTPDVGFLTKRLAELIGAGEVDVLLAGDVFYDAAMSERVQPWLLAARAKGARVVVGDPGRHYLPRALMRERAAYDVPTTRDLEGVEVKRVVVYELD